jgi:hypothetical protein
MILCQGLVCKNKNHRSTIFDKLFNFNYIKCPIKNKCRRYSNKSKDYINQTYYLYLPYDFSTRWCPDFWEKSYNIFLFFKRYK